MKKNLFRLLACVALLSVVACKSEVESKKERMLNVLGYYTSECPLRIDTLEAVKLESGWRYKIKYLAEDSIPTFHLPQDWVYAYLFVPDGAQTEKRAGIVAIHQDGISFHIGKSEPAGLAGDSSMFYGLELFERGYVVICPDRFYHAERRLLTKLKPWRRGEQVDYERDLMLTSYQAGLLMFQGRTIYSKEAHDVSRAVDVLCGMREVDPTRIGVIGHSAGGKMVPYAMFCDERIMLGVASCGVIDLVGSFDMETPQPLPAFMAIPHMVKEGIMTADFIKYTYPRSLLLTRGKNEWGVGDEGSLRLTDALKAPINPRVTQATLQPLFLKRVEENTLSQKA